MKIIKVMSEDLQRKFKNKMISMNFWKLTVRNLSLIIISKIPSFALWKISCLIPSPNAAGKKESITPWQAYFGLGKLDFGLGNPILDWQPNLGLGNPILDLATQSWTKIPLIRIYQFKFVISIITLNCTF